MKKLIVKSTPESIAEVEPFIEEIRKEYNVGDDVFGNILISITEAMNNAIIHGNGCDVSKMVELSCEYKEGNNSVIFRVRDEGEGFDHNDLPDPTSPENLEKITGRGVFLMKQLADTVIFEHNGSTTELHFKL